MRFNNGLSIGFDWVHNGRDASSKSSALLASYHPPQDPQWRWALYWERAQTFQLPKIRKWGTNRFGSMSIALPIVGGLCYRWQKD